MTEHTTLTFAQVASYIGADESVVQAIADDEISVTPVDPRPDGELSTAEIKRCEADQAAMLTRKTRAYNLVNPGRGTVKGAAWWEEDGGWRIEQLKQLWAQRDISVAKIGEMMGCGKNAALSKAHRLELPLRSPEMSAAARANKADRKPAPAVASSGRCAWPIGHPREPGFHFCEGGPVVTGRPYCARHCAIAYVPAGKKRVDQDADTA